MWGPLLNGLDSQSVISCMLFSLAVTFFSQFDFSKNTRKLLKKMMYAKFFPQIKFENIRLQRGTFHIFKLKKISITGHANRGLLI